MGSFFYGLSLIFPRLLDHTVEISVLICLIFLVKLLASSKLPPWWHYSLWLLLLVRMLVPLEFENRLNLFNFIPAVSAPQVSELISDMPPGAEMTAPPIMLETEVVEASIRFVVKKSIPVLWLAGTMILGVCILFESIIFWRSVRRNSKVTDEVILGLLSECKSRMQIKRKIDIIVTDSVRCPALFGYLRPRLLLPEGIFEKLSDRELAYAFMHELGHLKRHDIGVSWLMAGLQVIHWFNPLVWLAFYQIRIDQESACDAAVLSRMNHRQSADYARAIVGFLEKFFQNCQLPGLAGVLENRNQVKKRIAKIVQYRKSSQEFSFIACVLFASAGFLLFTLTGVAAEKRGGAFSRPVAEVASFELPGSTTEKGTGGAEKLRGGFRTGASELTSQLIQGREFPAALPPEVLSELGQDNPVIPPQRETSAEPRPISKEGTLYAEPAKEIETQGAFAALAEASIPMVSKMIDPEPIAGPVPNQFEKPASTQAASNVSPAVDGNMPAVAFESVQASDAPVVDLMTAKKEQIPPVVGPAENFEPLGGIDGDQKNQAPLLSEMKEDAGPVYPLVDNPLGSVFEQGLRQDFKDRSGSRNAAAGDNTAQKPEKEFLREAATTASMSAAQRDPGGNPGAFQAAEVDTPPRLIKSYPPRYPYMAKRDDISGSITLQFVVTKEGNAVETSVVESDPKGVFDEAALQAVEMYRFKPGIKDGKAVDVKVTLPIKFNLT